MLKTRSSLAFVLLLVHSLVSPASAQDGLQLLHKMQNALGGAKKVAAIRDRDEIESAATWNRDGKSTGKVVKRTRWVGPSLLRLDQVGTGNTYVLYFDGAAGWEILPTAGEKSVVSLIGGELEFAQKYLRDLDFHVWLADRDPRNKIESPAANIIRISDKDDSTHQLDITLDPTTWLPAKQTTVSLADPAHPQPSETRFDEWQTVQGLRFPRRMTNFKSGLRVAEITVERVELNKDLRRDDLAIKPADLSPVLSQK